MVTVSEMEVLYELNNKDSYLPRPIQFLLPLTVPASNREQHLISDMALLVQEISWSFGDKLTISGLFSLEGQQFLLTEIDSYSGHGLAFLSAKPQPASLSEGYREPDLQA